MGDSIQLGSNEIVILNRQDFEDNYYQLQGSCMATFQVVSKTEDTTIIAKLFQWQLESFKELPTEMGLGNSNLIFVFLGMFARNKRDYVRVKTKIIYSLKEADIDQSIIDWFEAGGKDSCFAKSENEWFTLIVKIISSDYRSCDQVNTLLVQGQGTDYDRIAIRVKGILEGYENGDNLAFVIRRVMERLKII